MPTYDEIGNAFGSSCESYWKLRDQLRVVALRLKVAIKKVGNIPEDRFGFAPKAGNYDSTRTYDFSDAFSFNSEKKCWELCYFIDVRRGKDILPAEILVFTVCLVRNAAGFELNLEYPEKYVTTIPEAADSGQIEKLFEEISERILKDILEYYQSGDANLRAPPDADKRRVTGFGS